MMLNKIGISMSQKNLSLKANQFGEGIWSLHYNHILSHINRGKYVRCFIYNHHYVPDIFSCVILHVGLQNLQKCLFNQCLFNRMNI